ncbi:estradiol 17-beta-dehydrogenase 8-like [Dermacentor silvarum]|uniref:estradiol 17-beta-dehydrogenase 8-like n=1 Tax=Dermacentor silvarum TaxID=543639 RepID=UPI0018977C31|nr:estradiol 17-beta-dehydrogenase 8-like [Dermacentor silvarum]
MSAEKELSGRLAVVTGGGSGIGEAICHVLAERGARVVVADINFEAAQKVSSCLPGDQDHRAVQVDVGESASVEKLFEETQGFSGGTPVSIVINNAGIGARFASIADASEDDFDHIIKTNLKGTFLMSRAGIRLMLAAGVKEGAVVNVSSLAAKSGMKGIASYVASKSGILGLTKSMALDVAATGIRCNAVLPGFTVTPLSDHLTAEEKEQLTASIPLGRPAQPREVAQLVAFLCGPQSSYMVGAAVEVSGGAML